MIWVALIIIALVFAASPVAAWRHERAVRRYEEHLASNTESRQT